jgi:hypothetical protein
MHIHICIFTFFLIKRKNIFFSLFFTYLFFVFFLLTTFLSLAPVHFASPAKIGHFVTTETCYTMVVLASLAAVIVPLYISSFLHNGKNFFPSPIFAGVVKFSIAKCRDMLLFVHFMYLSF